MNYSLLTLSVLSAVFIAVSPVSAAMDSMPSKAPGSKGSAEQKRFPSAKERVEQDMKKPLNAMMKKDSMVKNMNGENMGSAGMKKSMTAKPMGMKKSMKKPMKQMDNTMNKPKMKK